MGLSLDSHTKAQLEERRDLGVSADNETDKKYKDWYTHNEKLKTEAADKDIFLIRMPKDPKAYQTNWPTDKSVKSTVDDTADARKINLKGIFGELQKAKDEIKSKHYLGVKLTPAIVDDFLKQSDLQKHVELLAQDFRVVYMKGLFPNIGSKGVANIFDGIYFDYQFTDSPTKEQWQNYKLFLKTIRSEFEGSFLSNLISRKEKILIGSSINVRIGKMGLDVDSASDTTKIVSENDWVQYVDFVCVQCYGITKK